MWMKEGDEWKAVFRTNCGLFEPLVMFFGLCNSPATFQTMMNNIFDDFISKGVVVVYLDDILIFTKTLEEHRVATRRVLQLLKKNSLFLNDNIVLLTLNLFAIWALQGLQIAGEEKDILQDIQKGTRDGEKEVQVGKVAVGLQSLKAKLVQSAEWSMVNGILYF